MAGRAQLDLQEERSDLESADGVTQYAGTCKKRSLGETSR